MGKVLVVDDELDICILLTEQLQRLGFQASYCLRIKDAYDKLSTTDFDLVIADLNLPDGSGFDLVHSLRAVNKNVKIIIISAYETERHKALALGADLYVAKPFTRTSIREALKELNFIQN